MAKKKQHIDEFFKDRLDGQQLPLDGSEWDRIASELAEEKKRRGFFWWFLLIPAVLLGLWIGGLFNGDGSTELPKDSTKESLEPMNDSRNNGESEPLQDLANNAEETVEEETPEEGGNLPAPNEQDANSNELPNPTVDQQANNGTEQPNEGINEIEDPSSVQSGSMEDAEEVQGIQLNAIASMKPRTAVPFDHQEVAMDISELNLSEKSYLDKKTGAQPQLPWQIGLSIGGAVNNQQLTADQDSLVEYRNINEQAAFSPSIKVALRTTYKGLQLEGGLNYFSKQQSLGAAFSSQPEMRIQLYDSIPFVDLNQDTTWLPFNYRDSVINTDLKNPSYQTISIPIYLGKQFELGRKSSLGLGLQLQPQYILGASGTINAPSLSVRELDASMLQRFNLSAGLHLNYAYELHPAWQIEMRTGLQTDLLNMSRESGIEQRFRMIGTEIGVYYRFR